MMTQPVFDPALVPEIYGATAHLDVPIFLGVMPLTTYRNATFLHNDVPGIRIPEETLNRIKEDQEEGLAVAKELIDVAVDHAPP